MIVFKFVELAVVTEDTLEETVNTWVSRGWELEDIRFVITEHSKRPSMAFVSFVREAPPVTDDTTTEREAVTLNDLPVGRAAAVPDEAPPPRRKPRTDAPPVELPPDESPLLDLADPPRRS
jgi:hypothetical protein